MTEGSTAACQTWAESDGAASIFTKFFAVLENPKPNTTYELFVRARSASHSNVVICAWEVAPDLGGSLRPCQIAWRMITVPQSLDSVECVGRFRTTEHAGDRAVLLTTSCTEGAFPVTVYWDDWRLVEAEPTE